jgi:hypothetical protein
MKWKLHCERDIMAEKLVVDSLVEPIIPKSATLQLKPPLILETYWYHIILILYPSLSVRFSGYFPSFF